MVGEFVMRCEHTGCAANGLTHCMIGTVWVSRLVLLLRRPLTSLFQLHLMFPRRMHSLTDFPCPNKLSDCVMVDSFNLVSPQAQTYSFPNLVSIFCALSALVASPILPVCDCQGPMSCPVSQKTWL